MLTDDGIFLAIDDVPITKDYVPAVARAIVAKVLEKLRPADPLAVIGALERAAQQLQTQADAIAGSDPRDYAARFPGPDARQLRAALDTFVRMGAA